MSLVVGVRWSFRGKDAGSACQHRSRRLRLRTQPRGEQRGPTAQPSFRRTLLKRTYDPARPVQDVLLVCPQERDFTLVRSAGLDERYNVQVVGRDLDAAQVDPREVLDETADLPADGAIGTKDRSALLAAVLTARRHLPGPSPQALFACQHKPTSRELQRQVVPEATPRFELLNGAPTLEPPFFVKPVVGRLSQRARRIDDRAELAELSSRDPYLEEYARLAELAGLPTDGLQGFLAEELAEGDEVTLEGYVHAGRVTVIGVTDSVMYPGTNSFERFEYPSRLAAARVEELAGIARRLLPALGFDGGFFNIEFFVPERGRPSIIEVNGRIASQFAPLVQALHGRSTYELLFALACGCDPGWTERRPDGVAVSYVLRTFEDAFVASAPDPEDGIEILAQAGRRLSEQKANDVRSFRLAIVYEAGETREEAIERARARAEQLTFRLERERAR
jgi:biotin carboxylase